MANRRGAQTAPIPAFDPQGAVVGSLPAITYAGSDGGADATLATVSKTLAGQVNDLADDLAKSEGKRAGLVAGQDADYRPSNMPTIRGKAYDEEATKVYFSNLNAKFQSDAMDVFEANKADPAGFKKNYDALVQQYQQNHVFPEVAGYFTTQATQLNTALRAKVLSNFDDDRKDSGRAALITNISQNDTTRQRLLAVDPNAPEVEARINALRDQNIQAIRAQEDSGALTHVQAAKAIADEQAKAATDAITARANVMTKPEDVEAYRSRLRKDFADGKLPGVADFGTLDGTLAARSKALAAQQKQQLADLNAKIDGFVDRAAKGQTPPTAEWIALEDNGKLLGAQGESAVALARQKISLQARLNALPIAEGDRLMLDLQTQAKGGAGARVMMTPADRDLAIRTIAGEAGGEGEAGQAAVAHVIRTRVLARGGTIGSVITAPAQFSVWNPGDKAGDIARNLSPDSDQYKAIGGIVDKVMAGQTKDPTGGADHYYAPGAADPAWAPELAKANDVTIGNHRFVGKPAHGGIDANFGALLDFGAAVQAKRRSLESQDPLLAAQTAGVIPAIAPLDPGDAQQFPVQLAARVAQADAVAAGQERAPLYIRPDERPQVKAILDRGGPDAETLIAGVIAGARGRAPAVLKELGGDAPELAHAGLLAVATGDAGVLRQVAEEKRAMAVPGARSPTPSNDSVATAWRREVGRSLAGMDAIEQQRTLGTVNLLVQSEYRRRGTDPLVGNDAIINDAIQRARGMTTVGDQKYGGVASVDLGAPGTFYGREAIKVQIPADVRQDRFGALIDAITDDDIKALPNPPVMSDGRVMTAAELRRLQPLFGPGGYRFGTVDPVTGIATPVATKDGAPFVLPWAQLAPVLRERLPDAFR